MKVIIVGGVAGGASCAARLRRLEEKAEIILLERGEYISYANCGLPYYIGGEIRLESDLTLQTPESFRGRFAVDVRVFNEAIRIDPEAKTVEIRDHRQEKTYTESFDQLVLSPGADPIRPEIPRVDLPQIFTLRTLPDAIAIRNLINGGAVRSALIVGGGYVGLEMAENLCKLGLEVTVADAARHVLGQLDSDVACEVHHHLRDNGVRLRLRDGIVSFQDRDGQISAVFSSGATLCADMVLLAVGVRPEVALAESAGLELSGRGCIKVDRHMRTSHPDIYAVGDAVEVENHITEEPAYIPLAGPANKQGRIAADNICGLDSAYRGSQGSSILKIFELSVACTGLGEHAVRDRGIPCQVVHTYSPSHATYYPGATNTVIKTIFHKVTGRLLGAQLVGGSGVDKRCDVLATAIRAKMTAADLAELELSYAPPYSSAKDPINMAGFIMENLQMGLVKQFNWSDADMLPRDAVTLLDVRTTGEYQRGHIKGAVNIPLDLLRKQLGDLDLAKPVYVNCQSGLRSYIACRILSQRGFDCYNLSGGYRLYDSATRDRAAIANP